MFNMSTWKMPKRIYQWSTWSAVSLLLISSSVYWPTKSGLVVWRCLFAVIFHSSSPLALSSRLSQVVRSRPRGSHSTSTAASQVWQSARAALKPRRLSPACRPAKRALILTPLKASLRTLRCVEKHQGVLPVYNTCTHTHTHWLHNFSLWLAL